MRRQRKDKGAWLDCSQIKVRLYQDRCSDQIEIIIAVSKRSFTLANAVLQTEEYSSCSFHFEMYFICISSQ